MIEQLPQDVPGLWEGYQQWLAAKGIARPRVVIHGGYGKNNFGDDAILHVLIGRVRRYLPDAQIIVLCHGPARVKANYPDIEAYYFKRIGALKAIIRSHIYIIGGGGIVNVINTYSGYRSLRIFDMKGKFLFIAAFLAKLFGAKTHFYAIGATSFPDAVVKGLCRFVLNRADVVSVRDPLSIENLKKIGVTKELVAVADPGYSLEPAPKEQARQIFGDMGIEKSGKPLVGLNMRYVRDERIDNAKVVDETVKLVQYLTRERGADVLFIPISQHPSEYFEDDLDFGRQVRSRLEGCEGFYLLEYYPHPTVMAALLGQMDLCILMRLHAVLLTAKMGVPLFVISYDHKVTQAAKALGKEDHTIVLDDFEFNNVKPKFDNIPFKEGSQRV